MAAFNRSGGTGVGGGVKGVHGDSPVHCGRVQKKTGEEARVEWFHSGKIVLVSRDLDRRGGKGVEEEGVERTRTDESLDAWVPTPIAVSHKDVRAVPPGNTRAHGGSVSYFDLSVGTSARRTP